MSATERYGFDLVGNLARAAEELDAAFAGAWAPNLKTMVKATRTYGYFGGPELQIDGTIAWYLNGTVVCPNNALSLVQRQRFTGAVIAVTPAVLQDGYLPMAVARCVSGNLTRFVDARDSVLGTGARLLDDLEDVSLYNLVDGDTLRYNATLGLWINVPNTAGGIDVRDEGIGVVTGATVIDFVGGGVAVTDVGGVPTVEVLAEPGPGGGVLDFPDSLPGTPSQYDEEGDQGSLDASWTETSTPHVSYVRETNRDGTWIGMSGPGNATHTWTLRKPIDNADGDYPTAFTLTAKIGVSAAIVNPAILIGVGNNATFLTNTYVIFGLLGGNGLTSSFYSDFNGVPITVNLSEGLREIYVHLQRNTAATNNVKLYISISGRAWVLLRTITTTVNFDYLWLYFQGGGAAIPVALWTNYVRVNDPRFLQPE